MTKPGPGKFEGNDSLEIAEFIYDLEMNGFADEILGHVETFGYHSLHLGIDNVPSIPPLIRDEIKPAYITLEDNNGFFTVVGFDSNAEAVGAWRKIEVEFAELQETYA